jgi:hypothetical protein
MIKTVSFSLSLSLITIVYIYISRSFIHICHYLYRLNSNVCVFDFPCFSLSLFFFVFFIVRSNEKHIALRIPSRYHPCGFYLCHLLVFLHFHSSSYFRVINISMISLPSFNTDKKTKQQQQQTNERTQSS